MRYEAWDIAGQPTVACSLRNIETSSGGIGRARHCCAGRAKIWTASQPSARPRAMAFQAPPATDSCAPSNMLKIVAVPLTKVARFGKRAAGFRP